VQLQLAISMVVSARRFVVAQQLDGPVMVVTPCFT
jgi:hypothetical protein